MSRIIGIDLGTSTSEVSVYENGKPVIISDSNGNQIIPSVVYIALDGTRKVGEPAISYAVLEPENTVIEVKRLMGTDEILRPGNEKMTPQQISACIISHLKSIASEYLGEEVEEAVITVPAYFTDRQRAATKEAGILAGLKIERIINEPTAAALAYGINHMKDIKHVLVYDLGGGTLDVTVLEMFEGVLDVKASNGNNHLGGKDFDEVLVKHVIESFSNEYGINLSSDKKAMARLKEACEKAKIQLSENKMTRINLPFITSDEKGKPLGIDMKITRDKFETLIKDMIESTLEPIDMALQDAGLKEKDIETVIPVGGSTRIPMVRKLLAKKFNKEPLHELDPDKAVAAGACIQAAIKEGIISSEKDIVITDVCPYTLGIDIVSEVLGIRMEGIFDPLIKRNTTVPVSVSRRYYTSYDYQKEVEINVYQGDDRLAKNNNLIGEFLLTGVPANPRGEESIDVEFSYDINGILNVNAVVTSIGKKAGVTVDTANVKMEREIDIEEAWKNSKLSRRYRALIKKAELYIKTADPNQKKGDMRFDFERQIVKELLHDLKKAIAKEEETAARRYEDELMDILYEASEGKNRR
jgi:molecular chaperone DnaK